MINAMEKSQRLSVGVRGTVRIIEYLVLVNVRLRKVTA